MLYTFLVISFALNKECMISFSKFSDVLPAFTYARAIGNLRSFCLGVDVLNSFPCVAFIGNIRLLEALRAKPL